MSFQIEDFAPEAPANPYTEAVQALIEAGEGKALTITVDRGTKRDGTPGDGQKDRLAFQQAANEAGYTARQRKEADAENGQIALTFTLTTKHKRAGVKRGTTVEQSAAEVAAEPGEAEVAAVAGEDAEGENPTVKRGRR